MTQADIDNRFMCHQPVWINIKSAQLYPDIEIGNQPCVNYRIRGG